MIGSRQMGQDPTAVLARFNDRQLREEQFSEDIRKVVYGGTQGCGCSQSSGRRARSSSAGGTGRTRSPGLAAGAALALGGGSTAAEVHAEAHGQRQQAVDYARRRACPFDDHIPFGAGASDREKPRRLGSPVVLDESSAAHQAAHALGKHNRDIGQKIGAGAPFDAPEKSPTASSNAAASEAVWRTQCFAEAQAEAAANKSRMKGAQDLIAGGYWGADTSMTRRSGSLPPRGPRNTAVPMGTSGAPAVAEWQVARASLLPQAQVKLQYDGGSACTLTRGRAEYLNTKVLAEANLERNRCGIQLG